MRKNLALLGAVALLGGARANAALLAYEPFDYPAGPLLGQTNASTGNNWLRAGVSAAPTAINVTAGSLTPPLPLQPAVGNALAITGIGDNSGSCERLALPSPFTTGTMYYSMALRIDALTGSNATTGGFAFGFNNTGNSSQVTNPTAAGARLQLRIDPGDATKYNIGIFTNVSATAAATSWSGPLIVGDTQYIVASYEMLAGAGNDVARIWINPAVGDLGAPTAPTPSFTGTGGTDLSSISSILVRQSPAPHLTMDEIRVGDDWASATSIPEPAAMGMLSLASALMLRRKRA
jgi:hypothetical protein